VHIAGSKGKGSTAAMLASILTAAGHRTGLFTSPHIERFEERIQIDGVPIESQTFVDLVERLRPVAEAMDHTPLGGPTFFELTTALGWLHFQAAGAEIVVLEVGLGGRLDATNLCRSVATLITSISRDHTRLLGETCEEIAREKAGIIKRGIPMLTAVDAPGPLEVIREIAAAHVAPLLKLGSEIRIAGLVSTPSDLHGETEVGLIVDAANAARPEPRPPGEPVAVDPLPHYSIDVATPQRTHSGLTPRLPGIHQTRNAALAVAAADLLDEQGFNVPERAIREGLLSVRWPLRIEMVGRRPLTILDAAHNEASIAALVETLSHVACERRVVVFGASRDKDVRAMLRQLDPFFHEIVLTSYCGNPRALPAEELAELARMEWDRDVHVAPTPAAALELARTLAGANDLVCVTGSFFLAGEVRELMGR
jgi:dihydrofolate synthase/folylpolyglutamate synthase